MMISNQLGMVESKNGCINDSSSQKKPLLYAVPHRWNARIGRPTERMNEKKEKWNEKYNNNKCVSTGWCQFDAQFRLLFNGLSKKNVQFTTCLKCWTLLSRTRITNRDGVADLQPFFMFAHLSFKWCRYTDGVEQLVPVPVHTLINAPSSQHTYGIILKGINAFSVSNPFILSRNIKHSVLWMPWFTWVWFRWGWTMQPMWLSRPLYQPQ